MADISVVIPTRDRWRLLRSALQSALAQSSVSVEVVVVDDGSQDETPERLVQFDDPRVRVFRHEASRGVAAARNVGIQHARASWIAFLDDDDLWSPEKLERQLRAATDGDATFVYAGVVFVDETLDVIEVFRPPRPDDLIRSLLPGNSIPAGPSNVIARTDVVRRLGGFDEQLFQLEDWDFWIRLAQAGRPAACCEPLVAYRVHRGNMRLRPEAKVFEEIERLAGKHAELAAREGIRIDRAGYTRWIASIKRREGKRAAAAAIYLQGAVRYRDPGNVPRALGALLGERAMRLGRAVARVPDRSADSPANADVSWLERYR